MAKGPADTADDIKPETGNPDDIKPLDDEGGKGAGAKKLLIILVPILLIGVGAALYFMGVLGPKKAAVEGEGEVAAVSAEGGGEEKEGVLASGPQFLELPDLLVNLSTAGGPARFLKLKVKLEVGSAADKTKLEGVVPRVVDQFQTFLREMRVQDLRGSAGIYRLRQELLYRVNMAAQPVKVKDVLFQEILIQ